MALDKSRLDPTGSGSKGTKVQGTYETTDAKATVKGAGYFNLAAKELARTGKLLIFASDATFEAKVTIAAGVVTIAAMDAFA
jgi:hypothetical protein